MRVVTGVKVGKAFLVPFRFVDGVWRGVDDICGHVVFGRGFFIMTGHGGDFRERANEVVRMM
jgi:hypothetical protein